MAQVPERCMQMLKQIITEIENRQNITRDQLALLLETTDTGDIAFLHERARKTADAIYGKQVFIRGLIEFTNTVRMTVFTVAFERAIARQNAIA